MKLLYLWVKSSWILVHLIATKQMSSHSSTLAFRREWGGADTCVLVHFNSKSSISHLSSYDLYFDTHVEFVMVPLAQNWLNWYMFHRLHSCCRELWIVWSHLLLLCSSPWFTEEVLVSGGNEAGSFPDHRTPPSQWPFILLFSLLSPRGRDIRGSIVWGQCDKSEVNLLFMVWFFFRFNCW